ncbi:TolC family outer membrane protein [Arenibacterium sp. CAU 1754]
MRRAVTAKFFRSAALAAAVSFAALAPQAGKAENLADALVGAYNTSGLLEQNRALLRAADEDVAIAVARLRPVLDFILSARHVFRESGNAYFDNATTNTNPLTAQLIAEWLFYDGGARGFGVEASKETVLATRQSLVSIEQTILFRAVSAYLQVILQSENVTLRLNNLRVLNEELRAAQDRFDVGEVTRTDVALAQSRVAAARSELATARGEVVKAQAEYANAVGRKPGTLAGQPKMPKPPASIDAAVAVAVRSHPDILAAQHQVSAAELTIQQRRHEMGPTASLRAEVGATEDFGASTRSGDATLSLNLSKRLYQGGARPAQVRLATARRDSARANLLTVQRNVIQDVNDAYVRLQVAQASLTATAERIRAAQVAFDGIREEATLGARTTLDVLSAEQELLNALTAQISARSEQSLSAYLLLQAQGLLTAERLGLDVQIYDPALYYNLSKSAPANRSKQSRELDRVLKALGKK